MIETLPRFDSLRNVRFDDLNDMVDKINEVIEDYNKRIAGDET